MIVAVSAAERRLVAGTLDTECRIGRSGACPAASKREGDGFTPIGEWPIRAALLRHDRGLAPPRHLPWRWIRPADGWCDDPADPAYNHAIAHPCPASAERLWRSDAAYDAIVVLGHNDAPPRRGLGSAIFLHIDIGNATEGCVAIGADAMAALLAVLAPGDRLRVA